MVKDKDHPKLNFNMLSKYDPADSKTKIMTMIKASTSVTSGLPAMPIQDNI